jgi:hypothetical protein
MWIQIGADSELSLDEVRTWLLKTDKYRNCEIVADACVEDFAHQRLYSVPMLKDPS